MTPPETSSDAGTSTDRSTSRTVQDWVALWNGDPTVASALLDDELVLHVARVDGVADDRGPQALTSWVATIRTLLPDLDFAVEVGPFRDGDVIVLRWVATGHYAAGFPGATSPAGTPVRFTGTDIVRLADGRVAEYWLNADMHVLLAQLGVLPG